jgi:CHAD domain-containing protein
MKKDPDNLKQPARKLRKSLKSLPSDLPVDFVHRLRTQTGRLEAIVSASVLERKKHARQLIKTLKPVRKAAGDVRDMDVLTAKAQTLAGRRNDSVERLVEHLVDTRVQSARTLLQTLARRQKKARRSLKGFSKQIAQRPGAKKSAPKAKPVRNWLKPDATSRLVAELNKWPELSAENLHEFRLKIKELLYVLNLVRNADVDFMDALGKAKDEIGDWHDWYQLTKIAEQALDIKHDRAALKRIEDTSKKKLEVALAAARDIKGRVLNV